MANPPRQVEGGFPSISTCASPRGNSTEQANKVNTGFAAKTREDAKLDEDFRSASPVSQCHGGRHRLVPFVLEEGGMRFGDHALALLSEIAELGAQAGKLKAPESWASSSPNAASAYWVRKWKQEVSGWLQVTMSDTLLRQTSRASVYGS